MFPSRTILGLRPCLRGPQPGSNFHGRSRVSTGMTKEDRIATLRARSKEATEEGAKAEEIRIRAEWLKIAESFRKLTEFV